MTKAAAAVVLLLACAAQRARAQRVVTLDSSSPLVRIKVMVLAGSSNDPAGLEGLSSLAGRLLVEGGFGAEDAPVTKDRLAEITRPWGSGAYPGVAVSKESTTFSMTVPREVLPEFVARVLSPMLRRPLFLQAELDRVRAETLQELRSSLRLEQIEALGLAALDASMHENTSYSHPDLGTAAGLAAVDRKALRAFYEAYYRPGNVILGLGTADPKLAKLVREAFAEPMASGAEPIVRRSAGPPEPVRGREVLVVALPNAISTGIHAAFPLPLTRKDPDYWPLYVANIWLGTHRDGFSHLYQVIREARGYNYGDYTYVEHFEDRPLYLFPPVNFPRRQQYFSLWIRPVQHEYAAHVMRAATWELENFARVGLSEEQCAQARNKAKVLYLSLAESSERILGSRVDDAFYRQEPGYLDGYLSAVASATCERMNAAVRKYLQAKDLKYVVVTSAAQAPKLVDAIVSPEPVWGKPPEAYQIESSDKDGRRVYMVPSDKLELLRLDAVWAHSPLEVPRERVRVVGAERMFETAEIPRS